MGDLAGEKMKDFGDFQKKTRGGPSASMMERAAARSSWEAQRVPSSKYHCLSRILASYKRCSFSTTWVYFRTTM